MIHSLRFALELHERHKTTEILVSEGVLREVLALARKDERLGRILLNCYYDSPRYRYIHQVKWCGVHFISLSNEEVAMELCQAGAVAAGGS